jgi:hypothetical protein
MPLCTHRHSQPPRGAGQKKGRTPHKPHTRGRMRKNNPSGGRGALPAWPPSRSRCARSQWPTRADEAVVLCSVCSASWSACVFVLGRGERLPVASLLHVQPPLPVATAGDPQPRGGTTSGGGKGDRQAHSAQRTHCPSCPVPLPVCVLCVLCAPFVRCSAAAGQDSGVEPS